MSNQANRREFDRYPLDFEMTVSGADTDGNEFSEPASLQDISGGGARFISQQAGKYFPGQFLDLIIYLPGTDDVIAHMKGKATVVRISSHGVLDENKKSSTLGIAVKFDGSLLFERDAKTV